LLPSWCASFSGVSNLWRVPRSTLAGLGFGREILEHFLGSLFYLLLILLRLFREFVLRGPAKHQLLGLGVKDVDHSGADMYLIHGGCGHPRSAIAPAAPAAAAIESVHGLLGLRRPMDHHYRVGRGFIRLRPPFRG